MEAGGTDISSWFDKATSEVKCFCHEGKMADKASRKHDDTRSLAWGLWTAHWVQTGALHFSTHPHRCLTQGGETILLPGGLTGNETASDGKPNFSAPSALEHWQRGQGWSGSSTHCLHESQKDGSTFWRYYLYRNKLIVLGLLGGNNWRNSWQICKI